MTKRLIAGLLAITTLFTCTVFASANETDDADYPVATIMDTDSFRRAVVKNADTTITSIYDKEKNALTVIDEENGRIVNETVLNLNQLMAAGDEPIGPTKDKGTRIDYEHTYSNFEWEKYYFTGYAGTFWYLRNPHDPNFDERSAYENPPGDSTYTNKLEQYENAVNTINSCETVFMFTAATVVGAYVSGVALGTSAAELVDKVTSILGALGVTGVGASINSYCKAIEKCDSVWIELFY